MTFEFERDFELEMGDIKIFERRYSLTWDHEYGGTVACVPEISDGLVYFGCDDHTFYALDVGSGKEVWRFRCGGCAGNYAPVVVGNIVFFGSYDGYLYALDKETGKLLWKLKTGGSPSREKVIDFSEVALVTIITGEGVFIEGEKEEKYSSVPEIQVFDNIYTTKSEYTTSFDVYKSERSEYR